MTFDLQSQIDLANKISLVALKTGMALGRQEAKESAAAQSDSSRPLVNLPELRGSLDSSEPIVGDKSSFTADVPKERLIADRANVTGPASAASPSLTTANSDSVAVSGTQCPRLDEIVSAVAYVFSVADETAYAWIIEAIAADRKDA